jgi:ABC-type multidrug transport system ATPase subunit
MREIGHRERAKVRATLKKSQESGALVTKRRIFPVDLVLIRCRDVCYSYRTARSGGEKAKQVFHGANVDIPQGGMFCICGPQGKGKNTFLMLLGQVLVPDTGYIFIPPHLRVLYVPSETYFIKEDIVANLFFGCGIQWNQADASASVKGLTDSEWRRALRICERLGFPDRLMKYLHWDEITGISQQEEQRELMGNNAFAFTRSDRSLLQIARALICNPEVLVIQNPTLTLDRELRKLCWKALRHLLTSGGSRCL